MRRNLSRGWSDYPDHFSTIDDAAKYDELFESNTCERVCWSVQRPLLLAAFDDIRSSCEGRQAKGLDFACGTGRITEMVQAAGIVPFGLDASAAMLASASKHLPNIEFRTGLLGDEETSRWLLAAGSPFDLITAFRFFLNSPESQREPILAMLVEHLARNGRLVLNNHGSDPSLRSLGLRLRRGNGATVLSRRSFASLLDSAGLKVEQQWGGQLFTRSLYALPVVGRLVGKLETLLPRSRFGQALALKFGSNQTYVCRRLGSSPDH